MRKLYAFVYYRSDAEDKSRESSHGRRWIEHHPAFVHRFDGDYWLLCTVVDRLSCGAWMWKEGNDSFLDS